MGARALGWVRDMGNRNFQFLITGGVGSGRTKFAEAKALELSHDPIYISTSEMDDAKAESQLREAAKRRGSHWGFVHAPLNLVGALKNSDDGATRLVDSLSLWVANLLFHQRDCTIETRALLQAIEKQRSPLIFLSEEIGLGFPPENEWAQHYRRILGGLNQEIAREVGHVELVVCGYPVVVK